MSPIMFFGALLCNFAVGYVLGRWHGKGNS